MNDKLITSKSLYLRPIDITDATDLYLNWLNDPEINQYLESRFVSWTLEMLSSYIKELSGNKNEMLFAICLAEDNQHIGNIKLGPINWQHLYADIGIIIGDKGQWGKGKAAEAIEAVCRFGFQLGLNKITAGCYGDNIGSFKAFTRVGFEEEGRVRRKFISQSGYQDHILLGLLADDFK